MTKEEIKAKIYSSIHSTTIMNENEMKEWSSLISSLAEAISEHDIDTFDWTIDLIDETIDAKIMHLLKIKTAFNKIRFED